MPAKKPAIIAFLCNWCAYDGADAAGRARLKIPNGVREIRVMCSGQVDPGIILKAFETGADGILVLGCQPGDCHYRNGNHHALKRITLLHSVLASTPIHPKRLRLDWVSAGEGDRYARVVNEMVATIKRLHPAVESKAP